MSSSTVLDAPSAETPRDDVALEYRALYSGALLAALFGLLSFFMLAVTEFLELALQVAVIPIAGIAISFFAIRKISNNSDIYTGKPLAWCGLLLSIVLLLWGLGHAGYVHATEVPDGYERISFLKLKPDHKDEEAGRPVPKDIIALGGKQVFIKGYIRPGSVVPQNGADEFLLVRDNNQCCFGDLQSVKYFDQMYVTLSPNLSANNELQLTRVGGRLAFIPQNLGRGAEYPVYVLQADYIE